MKRQQKGFLTLKIAKGESGSRDIEVEVSNLGST
jgi:hypothetical protein